MYEANATTISLPEARQALDEILRQGLAGYQVPDMIEEKLNQFR